MLEPNPGSPNLAENLARTLGEPWERDETSGSDRDDVRHARRIDSTTGTPRRHRITHGAVATIIARPASSGNRTVFFVPFGRASVARSFFFSPQPSPRAGRGAGGIYSGPARPAGVSSRRRLPGTPPLSTGPSLSASFPRSLHATNSVVMPSPFPPGALTARTTLPMTVHVPSLSMSITSFPGKTSRISAFLPPIPASWILDSLTAR